MTAITININVTSDASSVVSKPGFGDEAPAPLAALPPQPLVEGTDLAPGPIPALAILEGGVETDGPPPQATLPAAVDVASEGPPPVIQLPTGAEGSESEPPPPLNLDSPGK